MPNFTPYPNNDLENVQFKNELRALIQEEIWKAFDVAIRAATNPPVQLGHRDDEESRRRKEDYKQIAPDVGRAVISALNHLKADAQARVVEASDPARAERIRAMADPTF